MRAPRPKSLSGLMLIGFALVALPLLVAVVNAAVQMRKLSQQSQQLVVHGVDVTRETQELAQQITQMERTARLYQVIGNPQLLEVFGQHYQRFARSVDTLTALQTESESLNRLKEMRQKAGLLQNALKEQPQNSPSLSSAISSFATLTDTIAVLARDASNRINVDLQALQEAAAKTQKQLFWQSAALIPGTALLIIVFVFVLARPLRQIDAAISDLGHGSFSRPIKIGGPTDLEQLGQQLEWLRQRLLDLAQEKNRFLRHISHELKTPLANIREGTELLMEGAVGPLDTNQREVTAILRENGLKLQRLIENLLSFSAWQAKSVGLELSRFRLRPLLKAVLEAQQLTLIGNRVRLDLKVADLEITGDRGKLRLIFDNLLSNAVKFTPKHGAISIYARMDTDQLVIDFADSGPGIPKDDRSQVFDAFYTGKAQQSGHVKGTGIGLSVVMEFVQAHGGTIELVDGIFPGAHFRIRMPLRPAAARPRETADAA